jgi:hypothetical protein
MDNKITIRDEGLFNEAEIIQKLRKNQKTQTELCDCRVQQINKLKAIEALLRLVC